MSKRDTTGGGAEVGSSGVSATETLQRPDTQSYVYLTAALYAALAVGAGVTALLHDSLASGNQFTGTGATQWTAFAVLFAPLVAGAAGFYTGLDLDGTAAHLASLVGSAAGYLVLFMGIYTVNDVLLDQNQGEIDIALQIGVAVGIGVTGALFAYVADSYEDWT